MQWTFFLISFFTLNLFTHALEPLEHPRVAEVRERIGEDLKAQMVAKGLKFGNKIYIRTFKTGVPAKDLQRKGEEHNESVDFETHVNEGVVEIWVEASDGKYKLFKTYVTCMFSGHLGPKFREGDYQNPEGFYSVALFNPDSSYHLSMDVGFPNSYDQARGYTGSEIMIHGSCNSVGCLAMTDAKIEEIYLLAWEANQQGQEFIPIHMFPFPMTKANMQKYGDKNYSAFWSEIQPAFDIFENEHRPPVVKVEDGNYVISRNRE